MKTNLLLTTFFLGAVNAFAQPVITNAIMPGLGHKMSIHKAQYLNPGSAGANQVWNFSALTTSAVQNFTVDLPSATPYASSYTAATMQMNDGTNYEFWAVTVNDASCEGIVDSAGNQPNNIDMEKLFQFPLQYTTNYYDAWNGFFTWHPFGTSTTMMRYASSDVTYDGYGTLTTPSGTFSNVARLHIKQNVWTPTHHWGVKLLNDEYRWYSNLFHGPLLSIFTQTLMAGDTFLISGSKYQQLDPLNFVGLNKHADVSLGIYIFPNPAIDKLSVAFTQAKALNIQLFDVRATLVRKVDVPNGSTSIDIDIADLAQGVYLVQITAAEGQISHKKVVVTH